MPSEGLGWGTTLSTSPWNTSTVPPPAPPSITPAQLQQLTPGIQQLAPALPPPQIFTPSKVISLRTTGIPLLTLEQKQQILANLTKYQQYGYPIASWNALNPADQALLLQANIHPQGMDSASAPAPTSSATSSSSGMSTGEVVLIVGGVAAAGVAIWYFGFRKKG